MNWPLLIVGLVALERLAELIYAKRNTSALLRAGAHEIGRRHYPLIVLLHLSWLIAIYAIADKGAPPVWVWIAIFVLLAGRALLDARDTRPLLDDAHHRRAERAAGDRRALPLPAPPQLRGGDRRDRAPTSRLWRIAVAIVFSLLNAALLWRRIRIETAALDTRK